MQHYLPDCLVSDDCFQCPLAMCKYDDHAGYRRWKTKNLDKVMLAAINAEGLTTHAAARKFQVTSRTICRIKARNA